MSSRSAKHRKQKRTPARSRSARHRKPSPITAALQNNPTKTAAAVTGAVLIAAAAPAAAHWSGSVSVGDAASLHSSGTGLSIRVAAAASHTPRPRVTRRSPRAARSPQASGSPSPAGQPAQPGSAPQATHGRHHHHAVAAVYANPLRAVSGLVPERIDQGVDFSGAGPVYALGDAVITNATDTNYGWPDGGWITYRLTDGPGAGLTVFLAEDVRPTVSVGEHVTANTVIADMYLGSAGIETGWAMASGLTAESQLPEAGGISGAGPFPTEVGLNFEELLQALGVPAANNRYDYPSGILPAQYPGDWTSALSGTH